MLIGVDYYPEHWEENRWVKDILLMSKAKLKVVRLAEFSWSKLEPKEGNFDFSWLDKIINLLAKKKIKIIVGTPTAAPPAWLIQKHSDILPIDRYQRRINFGARRHYCFNNNNYKIYTENIVSKMCEYFKNIKTVIGWQIDNEFSGRCYCENCAQSFRNWLKKKYKTLNNLNKQWGTIFWSQEYSDWEQIPLPWLTCEWEGKFVHNPSLLLDFYRFSSDSIIQYQQLQINIIRKFCPKHFITHNFMGIWMNEIDYFNLAKNLDLVSWDVYPIYEDNPYRVGLSHDLMRGLKKKNFWILEQQTGAIGWWTNKPVPKPKQIRLYTYQSIAHGAEGVLFFRWRTCRFGTEQFWWGILNHNGLPQRRYMEILDIGKEIEKYGDYWAKSISNNEVAIVISYDSIWALEIQPHNILFNFWQHIEKFYTVLQRLGVGVDIISAEEKLSKYKLVIAPSLYILNEKIINNFKEYVKKGGILIGTFATGIKDSNNLVIEDSFPGKLKELYGITVQEYDSLDKDTKNKITDKKTQKEYSVNIWCDILEITTAEILAEYLLDFYANTPAVTSNKYGKGKAIYIATLCEDKFYLDFLNELFLKEKIKKIGPLPFNVEVSSLRKKDKQIIFILNYNSYNIEIKSEKNYFDIFEKRIIKQNQEIEIEKYGVKVLSEKLE